MPGGFITGKNPVLKHFYKQLNSYFASYSFFMRKAAPYILLAFMFLLVLVLRRCQEKDGAETTRPKTTSKTQKRNRGFDRTLSYIEYTEHARCRMQCRRISQQDVEEIMRTGKINYSKSEVSASPCPVYAVQGYTHDDEYIRVVFGQCDSKTKVITCYNLEEDFVCNCPGDEKKKFQ